MEPKFISDNEQVETARNNLINHMDNKIGQVNVGIDELLSRDRDTNCLKQQIEHLEDQIKSLVEVVDKKGAI